MDDGNFKQEKSSITKLEFNKVFSLDPLRKNKKKNLHHHYQNEEEEEKEKEKNQEFDFNFQNQDQVFHFQQPHELFSHYQNLDNNTTYLAESKKRSYFPPPLHPPSGRKQKIGASFGGGGEIVEVQGGHIIRSIGRKDRHSKVCTAKGPRDRRVRLAAHTAIQFYDVQDRLGYDRPSKAVDWLIKKAKASIDELAELPPWKPTTGVVSTNVEIHYEDDDDDNDNNNNNNDLGSSSKREMIKLRDGSDARVSNQNNSASSSGENAKGNGSFLPLSLDSDAISDTIKSFFPMGGCGSSESNSSAMQFQSFPQHNLLSKTSSQSQDLKLSLQSFQVPYNHNIEQSQAQFQPLNFFTGYDAQASRPDHQHQYQQQQSVELGRLAAAAAARVGGDTGTAFSGGAISGASNYLFNSQPAPPLLQQLFSQNQFLSQRGPLQSSYSPSIRAWIDPIHQQYQHNQAVLPMYSASGFASEVGGFSGFRIPTRIQGEIEEHDGISDKPSSASSDFAIELTRKNIFLDCLTGTSTYTMEMEKDRLEKGR